MASIFEARVASEVREMHLYHGADTSAFHYRKVPGLEVDFIIQGRIRISLVEVQPGNPIHGSCLHVTLVYGIDRRQRQNEVEICSGDRLEGYRPTSYWPDIRALTFG